MSEGAKDWARRQEVGVARFTLFVMCEVVDDRLEYFAGNEYLCRETGKSLGTINRHLELLKKAPKNNPYSRPDSGPFCQVQNQCKVVSQNETRGRAIESQNETRVVSQKSESRVSK